MSNGPDFMPMAAMISDVTGPIDKVGTTYVENFKFIGYVMKGMFEIVAVEPLRPIHEHSDCGPTDNHFWFEPDGDATRVVVEGEYEIPGRWPGFIKDLMARNWVERQTPKTLAAFKAAVEAKVPAHA